MIMKKNSKFSQLLPKNKLVFILPGIFLVILTLIIILFFQLEDDRKVLENDFLFLIGLDGADWNILNPLLEQNKLPALRSLIENGCYADLLAPEQNILSGPSWTSMATPR